MQRPGTLEQSSTRLIVGVLALSLAACAVEENGELPEDESTGTTEAVETPAGETEAEPAARPTVVPAGTSMVFRVQEPVSTETHEEGDVFTATLAEAVMASDGSVALPPGTSSAWVVTRSRSEGDDADQSLLAFRLQSVQVDGRPVPLQATVTETQIESDTGDTTTESVAKVAVGTAAGAIIGQILGRDTESTLKGAGVGAAVGAVVALTTGDGEARLAAGSTITVQLNQALPTN